MCLRPPHNRSRVSAQSVVPSPHLIPLTLKTVPLLAGLGLLLTVGLNPERAIAQIPPSSPPTSQAPTSQQFLFVNSIVGNDTSGDGSQRSPFRTITHALQVAQPNTVIMLAAGTYTAETGEVFPLELKPNVTIQGDPSTQGRGIVIRGGGAFLSPTSASQNITILGEDQAQLVGVTVTNPNPRGYGLWVESSSPIVMNNTFSGSTHDGISTVGSSAPSIQNNLFTNNGANGITVFGASQPTIQNNVFDRTGFGINIAENAAPFIVGNRISRNEIGVLVQENARPVLRNNTIEANQQDGLTAIAHSQPDLGTATEPGNNVFRNNGELDLNVDATDQVIPAFGNQLATDRLEGNVDLAGTTSVTRPVAAEPSPTLSSQQPNATSVTSASNQSAEPLQTASISNRSIGQLQSISASSPTRESVRSSQDVPPSQSEQPSPAAITEMPPAAVQTQPTDRVSTAHLASSHQPSSLRATSETTSEIAVPPPVSPPRQAQPPQTQQSSPQVTTATEIVVPPPERPVQRSTPSPVPSPAVQATAIAVPPPDLANPSHSTSPPRASQSSRQTMQNSGQNSGQGEIQPIAAAIEIPVPSPASATSTNSSMNSSLAYASSPSPSAFNAPIEIPVPLPESSTIAPASVASQNLPTPPQTLNSVTQTDVLPVPDGDVPVGNIGDLPTVSVARNPFSGGGEYTSRRARADLRYRVVVAASDAQDQSLVQSIAPDAFLTSINGQALMQVGAFSSRDNAEEALQLLNQNGLRGIIQEIE